MRIRERKEMARDMKAICRAESMDAAEPPLDEFEERY